MHTTPSMVIIGAPEEIAEIYDASLTRELVRHAHCAVHIVPSGSDDRPLRVEQSAAR